MIQLGDSGPGIRAWQRIVGIGASKCDGDFGPGTDAAVKAWQALHGVDPDGVIGPITRSKVSPSALIKPYEGLRLQTYDDKDGSPLHRVGGGWRRPDGSMCIGVATIGWGDTAPPRRGVQNCTREEADRWFDQSLASTYLPGVLRYVAGDAARICAAASCAYNCGTGWITQLAAVGFTEEKWMSRNKNGRGEVLSGLTMRRAEEWALWAGYNETTL
jgi:GH24 family phage-related lysozyme (muramidase)